MDKKLVNKLVVICVTVLLTVSCFLASYSPAEASFFGNVTGGVASVATGAKNFVLAFLLPKFNVLAKPSTFNLPGDTSKKLASVPASMFTGSAFNAPAVNGSVKVDTTSSPQIIKQLTTVKSGISEEQLTQILANFEARLNAQISSIPRGGGGGGSNQITSLKDVTDISGISSIFETGTIGTLSNTSFTTAKITVTGEPTEAHAFPSWTLGAADANATSSLVFINATNAPADGNVFAISKDGSARFLVDAEGDVFANSITATGGITLSTTTASTLTVENDLNVGDAPGDSIYITARLGTSLLPKTNNLFDIGSSTLAFRTGYFGTSIGIGTSTFSLPLSVEGNGYINGTLGLNGLKINNQTFTDLLGTGLTNTGGALTVSLSPFSTSDLSEGSNLYYTPTRFDNRLSATSTLPGLSTLAGLVTYGSTTATTTALGNLSVDGNLNFNGSFLQNGSPFISSQWTTAGSDIYYTTGKVGIGSTTPGTALSVNGAGVFTDTLTALNFVATSTTATSTFGAAITVGTGQGTSTFAGNLSVGGNLNFNGSFLQNGVAFVGSQWTTAGSDIYYSTGKVGVGSSTPWAQLSVNPTSANGTAPSFVVGSSTATRFIVSNGGNVGVGNTAPVAKFDVTGLMRISSATASFPTSGTGLELYYDPSNTAGSIQVYDRTNSAWRALLVNSLSTNFTSNGSNALKIDSTTFIGAGTTTPWARFSVEANSLGGAPAFAIGSSTATTFVVNNAGRVGIGTTTPGAQLSLTGNILGGTSGLTIYSGGSNQNLSLITSGTGKVLVKDGSGIRGDATYSAYLLLETSGILSVSRADVPTQKYASLGFYNGTSAGVWLTSNGLLRFTTSSVDSLSTTDTGLGRNAAGILEVNSSTAGTLRDLRLRAINPGATDFVGVGGTTTPWGKLSVVTYNQAITAPAFLVATSSTGLGTSTQFVITNGNVGIGLDTPTYKLQVNGEPAANGFTAFTNYSDARLKENINELDAGYLTKIRQLKPSTFNYNSLSGYDQETRSRQITGFVAQELKDVFPNMVGTTLINGTEYYDTNLSALPIYLVKAIQELDMKVDALASTTPGSGSFFSGIGEWVGEKITAVTGFFKHLTVGNEETPTAITVYDKNGKPGCMTIDDVTTGAIKIIAGVCGSVSSTSTTTTTSTTVNPEDVPQLNNSTTTPPTPTSTSTPESGGESVTASSTPETTPEPTPTPESTPEPASTPEPQASTPAATPEVTPEPAPNPAPQAIEPSPATTPTQ